MTEKLQLQIRQLERATGRLAEVLSLEPTLVTMDATIQRFEFTFELAWKVMKNFAYEKGLEAISPRDAIRTAAQLGLIEKVEEWFAFLEARNNSSHIYDDKMAADVYETAKKFLPEAKALIEKINHLQGSNLF
ncbi:nucleotidyltransferase substrate binding protein [Patescibacteria group bacterium]|nr:nucleotidyltransferase substrate binding protein [Patescibacteria group bacterium]MBU1473005.1 nucleotidyltransferase substrate binding protein [Patescibacteria group bacterium]MBU2460340.1 nucleotidyltransferase substrate binding protein [Patescibacteria group bacterium]MBU2544518.1 nucleotidyltransferase substrate binding protein [Patescibacteria group bacterium]